MRHEGDRSKTHPPSTLLSQPLHYPLQTTMIRAQLDLPRRVEHHERFFPPRPDPPLLLHDTIQLAGEPIEVLLEVLQAVEHGAVRSELVGVHRILQ